MGLNTKFPYKNFMNNLTQSRWLPVVLPICPNILNSCSTSAGSLIKFFT